MATLLVGVGWISEYFGFVNSKNSSIIEVTGLVTQLLAWGVFGIGFIIKVMTGAWVLAAAAFLVIYIRLFGEWIANKFHGKSAQ